MSLVSPCFKQSSKTCKEIRTKISPLYQNHKAYKMVYCSQKIASLSHCRVQKLSFKHTSYIPSFLIPTPTFHHIGVGVLRIRTRHLETHCYLLPLNAFITYDILIYITCFVFSPRYLRYRSYGNHVVWYQGHVKTHSGCLPFCTPQVRIHGKQVLHFRRLRPPPWRWLQSGRW